MVSLLVVSVSSFFLASIKTSYCLAVMNTRIESSRANILAERVFLEIIPLSPIYSPPLKIAASMKVLKVS